MPGVVAVWTHVDLGGLPPIDFRDPAAEALKPYRQPLLAHDRVRYVGEPVAAVFAEQRHSPRMRPNWWHSISRSCRCTSMPRRRPASSRRGWPQRRWCCDQEFGDVDAAFRAADCVIEADLFGRSPQRYASGMPWRARALRRAYDIVELWGAAKVPHRNREALARFLDRPAASVQLHEGHVGGGFGIRGELYPRTSWSASRVCALGGRSSGSRTVSST